TPPSITPNNAACRARSGSDEEKGVPIPRDATTRLCAHLAEKAARSLLKSITFKQIKNLPRARFLFGF
ncbi:MAG: hypothetical protein AAF593_17085, partial [Planctomycetota bacterium]